MALSEMFFISLSIFIYGTVPVINGHDDSFWVQYKDKHFMLVEEPMTWMEAQSICRSLGGFLATVSNSGERDFIKSMTHVYPNIIWLGGTDMFSEAKWVWIENLESISYNVWYHGGSHEPAGRTGENCLMWYNYGGGYFWHDVSCKHRYKFVCQRSHKKGR